LTHSDNEIKNPRIRMKLILNSGMEGLFCLSANGTLCSRVVELMARGKISLALALPILFSFA